MWYCAAGRILKLAARTDLVVPMPGLGLCVIIRILSDYSFIATLSNNPLKYQMLERFVHDGTVTKQSFGFSVVEYQAGPEGIGWQACDIAFK